MKKYFGITGKAVAMMTFVVLSITSLIAIFTYTQSENLMRQQIERELAIEIESTQSEISSFFEQKGEIVRQLSVIPIIKNLLLANETQESIQSNNSYIELKQLLNDTKEHNEHINLFWLANLEQNYFIANDDHISNYFFDVKKRPWYVKAQTQPVGISYSTPYTDFATRQPIVSVTHPISSDGQQLGYLGVDVLLKDLPTILQRFEENDHHLILLADNDEIIYDAQNLWPTLKQENLTENKVSRISPSSSKDVYYTDMRHIENVDWKIVIYVTEDIFLAPLVNYQSSLIAFWTVSLIILLIVLSLVLRHLLQDIPLITKQLEKIEQGDFNTKVGIKRQDEIGDISRAVDQMTQKIQEQIKIMNEQAHFDSLTKLPNRLSIENMLEERLHLLDLHKQTMAVAFFDLDYFKNINDSKGHAYGDELLIQVGLRIQSLLPKDSFFGRFGGDEFVLLLFADQHDTASIQSTLEVVHASFSESFKLFEHTAHITASMGVTFAPQDAHTKKELLANADTALYEAKEAGRNLICFFNADMKVPFEKSISLVEYS